MRVNILLITYKKLINKSDDNYQETQEVNKVSKRCHCNVKSRPHQRQCRQKRATLSPKPATLSLVWTGHKINLTSQLRAP